MFPTWDGIVVFTKMSFYLYKDFFSDGKQVLQQSEEVFSEAIFSEVKMSSVK